MLMKEMFRTRKESDLGASGGPEHAGDPEAERRRIARKRARAKLAFYRHLALYLVVSVFLLGLNLVFSPDALWFYWPAGGWGIALVAHGAQVYLFGNGSSLLRKLEERELHKMEERR